MVKIIENKYIPFKGFKLMNLFGFIFKRKNTQPVRDWELNHETIHTAQMKELLYIPFYILYISEWIFKFFKYSDSKTAYRNISFEKEAYAMQNDLNYLNHRKAYAQWRVV